MRDERFRALDGWRGLCAITVALYHLNAFGHFYEVPFIRNSWLLVDFFFVLSGFVITHAYMDRLRNWAETRAFIVRRFGRLWPLHISALGFLIGLEVIKAVMVKSGADAAIPAFTGERSVGSIFANLFLIHGLGIYDHFTWNVASWSISTELYTYVVFACVLLVTRSMTVFVAAVIALAIVSAVVTMQGPMTLELAFVRTVYGFFIGHITYRLWKAGIRNRVPLLAAPLEILSIVAVVAFLSVLSMEGTSLWPIAAPLVFAFVIWVFAHEEGPVSRFIDSRPVNRLGEWSYSVYMVHVSIALVLNRVIEVLQHRVATPLTMDTTLPWAVDPVHLIFFRNMWVMDGFAALYLVAVILTASFTYKWIEVPGRRFFNSSAWAQSTTTTRRLDVEPL